MHHYFTFKTLLNTEPVCSYNYIMSKEDVFFPFLKKNHFVKCFFAVKSHCTVVDKSVLIKSQRMSFFFYIFFLHFGIVFL